MVGTMTRPVAFGLNVDPNTGGLAIAARIAAIADAAGLSRIFAEEVVPAVREALAGDPPR
jgi:hypothetical protein